MLPLLQMRVPPLLVYRGAMFIGFCLTNAHQGVAHPVLRSAVTNVGAILVGTALDYLRRRSFLRTHAMGGLAAAAPALVTRAHAGGGAHKALKSE